MFHVIISSDSLSLPRPWHQKNVDERPEMFFRVEDTYPHKLRRRLRRECALQDIEVTNWGRRGATSGQLPLVARDVLAWMSPSVTVIHHGIVDCWIRDPDTMKRHVSEDAFAQNIREILCHRSSMAPTLPVFFLPILHTNEHMLAKVPQQNDIIDQYNEILRQAVSEFDGVHILSLFTDLSEEAALVHEDGHHLSRAGHQRVADSLAEVIVPLMK